MRRFPTRLALVCAFASLAAFAALYRGNGAGARSLRGVVEPALWGGRWAAGAAGTAAAWFRGAFRSEREVLDLRERVADLEARLVDRERTLLVLSRQMRQQSALAARLPGGGTGWIPGRVTGVDPSPWARGVWIDRGRDDGVREGAAAAVGETLVGRVAELAGRRARVQLLSDPASAALVQVWPAGKPPPVEGAPLQPDLPSPRGVLRGTGDEGTCRLEMVPNGEAVSPGDAVLTTGYDAKFPRGLFVGMVLSAEPGDVFLSIDVRLPVDLPSVDVIQVQRDLPAGGGRE